MSPEVYDCIVVGGGQSGMAASYYLHKYGVNYLVLDANEHPGGSWQHMWEGLTLFSPNDAANLPGRPMPHYDGFPPASHVVNYLTDYERRYDVPVERPVHADRVTWADGIYTVNEKWQARTLVAATGTWTAPFVPYYPGHFGGKVWHAATYPGSEPFRGHRVAVVGAANSAAQIAAQLAPVAELTWYTTHEPRWMPDDIDGRALFRRARARLNAIQRGEPDPGADSSLGDIVMVPEVLAARDQGLLTATPMFTTLDDVHADDLIWATGFRPAIRPFTSLLDDKTPKHPGMFFVGYGDWVGPGAATITGVAPFAKRAAQGVVDQIKES